MNAIPSITTAIDAKEYALGDRARPKGQRARLERATRRKEAIALRRAGVHADTIARQLGVSTRTVYAWIQEAIRDIPREEADDLRRLELDRLDALFQPQYRAALAGDPVAAQVCLRIMERRARMLNLDAEAVAGLEQVGNLLDRLVFGTVEQG